MKDDNARKGDKVIVKCSQNDYYEKEIPYETHNININNTYGYVSWGRNNCYPSYIYDLYLDSQLLKTIIDGITDYVVGNGIILNVDMKTLRLNMTPVQLKKVIKQAVKWFVLYSGYSVQRIVTKGNMIELNTLDLRCCRLNSSRDRVYYGLDFRNKYSFSNNYTIHDNYAYTKTDDTSSVFFFTNNDIDVYPLPSYSSSITSIETSILIDKFHHNAISNGFMGNVVFMIEGCTMTDEEKEEFEHDVQVKHSGASEAGKIVFVYNNTTGGQKISITTLNDEHFIDKYNTLSENTRSNIFGAFRATPNLFGIMNDTTGFNSQEFGEAFNVFNRTVIRPIQDDFKESLNELLGVENAIDFEPFTL